MSTGLSRMRRLRGEMSLPRAAGVTDGQVGLAYAARFCDEALGGMLDVLLPTIQQQLGLSLAQIALLRQVLEFVSAGVNPLNGLLLDVWPRRWLMGYGAAGLGLAALLVGAAPSFALLLMAWALYGAANGPLAHTGDVLIVEAYPDAPDRAFARGTLIDTAGALLGPLLVSAAIWLGLPWRGLLVGAGGLTLLYAGLIVATRFPSPSGQALAAGVGLWRALRGNVAAAAQSATARRWLLFLFCFRLLETPFVLKTIWLAQEVGMSQALIGLYIAAEMAVGMAGLLALDRWRQVADTRRVLGVVTLAVGLAFPAWLLTPGVWPRFGLMLPLAFFFPMYWPIAKASSLASVPGRAGVMTAASALFKWVPLPLLFGLLAEAIGLTAAMLALFVPALAVLAGLVWRGQG